MSDSFWPHGPQQVRLPCPSPVPGVASDSCPSSQWCHPNISSSVIPFSSCLQSFPASESFLMSQFFISGGQSIGASSSVSVLPMNIQDWYPLGLTGLISLQCKGLWRVFSTSALFNHLHPPAFQAHSSRRVSHTGMPRKILTFPPEGNKLRKCHSLYTPHLLHKSINIPKRSPFTLFNPALATICPSHSAWL